MNDSRDRRSEHFFINKTQQWKWSSMMMLLLASSDTNFNDFPPWGFFCKVYSKHFDFLMTSERERLANPFFPQHYDFSNLALLLHTYILILVSRYQFAQRTFYSKIMRSAIILCIICQIRMLEKWIHVTPANILELTTATETYNSFSNQNIQLGHFKMTLVIT